MKRTRHFEVLENGRPCGRAFGSLGAARSWVARQLRPMTWRSGWRLVWIRSERRGEPAEHIIRDKRNGRVFPVQSS